ncbi:zinc finger homeobox protein 4-like isoform X2 [Spodoptera frugiperda]|uniref:Zinc finger homeobox protein 4-like isoform X2 n=1 Tax=Spodoptera frugiperda TaxID=7108 RepID=A0A9R0F6V5_SPOFR|nr:zinc finger homeobox protein 4-like isoform X2 [Spodoptera frugiperda]
MYPHGRPPHGGPPPPPGGFTYVPAPVMMPVYQPPPPPPPPEPVPPPTIVTNYIYQQPPPPPPQPTPVTIVEEIRIQPQPSNPWANLLSTAEVGLSAVEKGLTLLETRKQERITKITNTIEWVPSSGPEVGMLRHRAFVAGREGWDGSPLCVIRAFHNGEFVPGKLAIQHQAAYIPHAGREVPVHNFEVLCASSHAVRWLPGSNGQVPVGAIPAGNTHNGEPLYIGRVTHMNSVTPGKVHPSHGCCYISFNGGEVAHKSYDVLCRIVG